MPLISRQSPLPLHSVSVSQMPEILQVDPAGGLPTTEANRRILASGANKFAERRDWSVLKIFFGQFSSIVVWLLALAAGIAFFTANELEGIAILTVLLLNAVIGFAIEWQAGRALEALKKATRINARVRRDRIEQIIDAEDLVTGDILILAAGDRVPADARILEAVNLRTDESTLTGESVPVEKQAEPVEVKTPLAERASMLYLGTTIAAGKALAVVTATGSKTEIGHIEKLVAVVKDGQTPLEKKLAELGKTLVYIVLGIALIVFLAGLLRGDGIWLMLEISISLAVAAVPEGLPAVTTLILALGVLRMARRHALVRKLSAVETLGRTTVICTDKTGTLTENKMAVCEYRLADHQVIEPPRRARADFSPDENLQRLLRVSLLCNDSVLEIDRDGQEKFIGDPTETALLTAVRKFGLEPKTEKSKFQKLFEHPFDSNKKRMIAFLLGPDGKISAALKGAPAVVLELCDRYLSENGNPVPMTAEKRAEFLKINEEMAGRALRVLAFAEKDVSDRHDFEAEPEGYVFLGLAGMTDPLRTGAAEAVKKAQEAGIRVVMLTGDQIHTARAIAAELNLSRGKDVFALHSDELAEGNSEKLASMAGQAHVFARVSPETKLRIVQALQKTGEIVAVTGDGVNDAPALKHADIGIAMGQRGTEVAKEASAMVLTDDNFGTIVKAVEDGRTIYANIIKFVHLLFSDNLGEVLVIFSTIMLGWPLPLQPLQILWVNLVTDVFPALALALEPASPETMKRRPHPPGETLLSAKFLFLIFWKGVAAALIVLATYFWALQTYGEGTHARTIALLSLIGVQVANLFNCRSRRRSALVRFFSNPFIFVAVAITFGLQILALYLSPLAGILETVRPEKIDFLVISSSLILPVVIVEITKAMANRKDKLSRRPNF